MVEICLLHGSCVRNMFRVVLPRHRGLGVLLLLLLDGVDFGHVLFLCLAFLFGESVFLSSSVSIEFGSFVGRGCLLWGFFGLVPCVCLFVGLKSDA